MNGKKIEKHEIDSVLKEFYNSRENGIRMISERLNMSQMRVRRVIDREAKIKYMNRLKYKVKC